MPKLKSNRDWKRKKKQNFPVVVIAIIIAALVILPALAFFFADGGITGAAITTLPTEELVDNEIINGTVEEALPIENSENSTTENETIPEPTLNLQDIGTFGWPNITALTLNSTFPARNNTNDNLTAYATTNDPDGDTVKVIYNWLRNGTSIEYVIMPFEKINDSYANNTWDYSGINRSFSNYSGLVGGNPVWNATAGHDGRGAYRFDGNNDSIKIGQNADFKNVCTNGCTFSAWAKKEGEPIGTVIGRFDSAGSGTSFFLLQITGNEALLFQVRADGTAQTCAASTADGFVTVNSTFHLSGTYNLTNVILYVNGTNVTNPDSGICTKKGINESAWNNSESTYIGMHDDASFLGDFPGIIDDVRIYNRTLSKEQLKMLYLNRTDILVANETEIYDNWTVLATGNDGANDSAKVTSNSLLITGITNVAPSITNLTLNTTNISINNTNVNLTVYVNTSDGEGDNVKIIYNWRLNSSSATLLNMPFEKTNESITDNAWDYSGFGLYGEEVGAIWNATGGYDAKGAYKINGSVIKGFGMADSGTSGTLTVTLWAYPSEIDSSGAFIFGKGLVANCAGYALGVDTTRQLYALSTNITSNSLTNTRLAMNSWNHVAYVFNQSGLYGYINGTFAGSDTAFRTAACSANNYSIGRLYANTPGNNFNGSIDDLVVWNRSLTPEQISALFNNRTDLIVAQETFRSQNWSVQATPNDANQDGGMTMSSNLTILNAKPTHTTPILNSTDVTKNTSSLNITVYVQNLSDPDGDMNIKNITNWLYNTTSLPFLNLPFEGGSSGSFTRDYAFWRNGTPHGASWNANGGYDSRGAYRFDGTDDYIDGNYPSTGNNDKITITAWINPLNLSQSIQTVFTTGKTGVCFGYGIVIYAGGVLRARTFNNDFIIASGIEDNAWSHIALVYNASGAFGYINGTFVGSNSSANTASCTEGNYSIGVRTGDSSEYYNGTVDDLVVWNRTLTQQQISALYNNRTDMFVSQELRKGDVWSVQVTPNDGLNDDETLTSNNITILDKTVPAVNITNPANGSNFSAVTYNFNATVTDTESSVSAVLFMFNTNTTPFNITASNISGSWNAAVNLATLTDRIHTVTVFANDTENNVNSSQSINFTVDKTPPNVTLNFLNNFVNSSNFSIRSSNQTFNASVFDALLMVSNVYFWFDNGTGQDFNVSALNRSGVWTASYNVSTLGGGRQGVRVVANDTVGNVNNTAAINFTADFNSPNVSIVSLNNPGNASNFSIRSNNQTFNTTIFDALTEVDNVYFWFDNGTGQDFNASATNQSGRWVVSYNVSALAEQRQGVRIMANDTVSNLNNSQVINFTVDFTTPNVTLNFLNNFANGSNFSIRSSNQTFNASVFDSLTEVSNIYFWFDNGTGQDFNVSAFNRSGVWTVSYNVSTLFEGRHSARVMANDTVGNLNDTFFINFTVDLNAPNVTVNNLNDNNIGNASNFSMKTNNVTFNVSVFDTTTEIGSVYFWFDNAGGDDFNVTGVNQSGQWIVVYNVSSLREGRQGVRIIANDTVSNTNNSVVINFTTDFTVPTVNITSPANGVTLTGGRDFNATVNDAITEVQTVIFQFSNGGSPLNRTASNSSGTWNVSLDTTILAEGTNTIIVFANDTVGNSNSSQNISVTIDNVAESSGAAGAGGGGGGGSSTKEPACGDGLVDQGEQCDSGDGCDSSCKCEEGYEETGKVDCEKSAYCGDGIANQIDEDCDGADLREESCISQGYESGELSCNQECTLDESSCAAKSEPTEEIPTQPTEEKISLLEKIKGFAARLISSGKATALRGKEAVVSGTNFAVSTGKEFAQQVKELAVQVKEIMKELVKQGKDGLIAGAKGVLAFGKMVLQAVVTPLQRYALYWLPVALIGIILIGLHVKDMSIPEVLWKLKPVPEIKIEQAPEPLLPLEQKSEIQLRSWGKKNYLDLHQELKKVEALINESAVPEPKNKPLKLAEVREQTDEPKITDQNKLMKELSSAEGIEPWITQMFNFGTSNAGITIILRNATTLTEAEIKTALLRARASQLLQKKYKIDQKYISELKRFIAKERKKGAAVEQIITDLIREGWDGKTIAPFVRAHFF